MLKKLMKMVYSRYSTKWVCPHCGCEISYGAEGSMKCPNCGEWMIDEQHINHHKARASEPGYSYQKVVIHSQCRGDPHDTVTIKLEEEIRKEK